MTWWVAGAALVSTAVGADGARRAGNQQADANMAALEEQRRQFDLLRGDQAPYREAGVSALERLRSLMGEDPTPNAGQVMAEPGYQFGLTQGTNAVQGSAAARGGLYSGQALKELTQFGNDYGTTKYGAAWDRAQQGFGNRWNRLAGLAGVGQTSVQATGAAGQNFANQAGNALTGAANARGASGMAQANIWGNALNQFGGFAANRFGGGGGGGGGSIWSPGYDSFGGGDGWTGGH